VSAVAGTSLVVLSMALFALVDRGSTPLVVLLALAMSGIGLGCAQPSISSSVANAVDEPDLGIASAAQQLVMQVGIVAGIQAMSTLHAETGSFRAAYLVGAVAAIGGVVFAAMLRSFGRDQFAAATSAMSRSRP
jgi:predicted MFS family arabinose efflux permease